MYLSCPGVSRDINPEYAQLYRQDFAATGEKHIYFSRDNKEKGREKQLDGNEVTLMDNILYATHHFEIQELRDLLTEAGFGDISVEQRKETSSRRPEESAYFLYATARRPFQAETNSSIIPQIDLGGMELSI